VRSESARELRHGADLLLPGFFVAIDSEATANFNDDGKPGRLQPQRKHRAELSRPPPVVVAP
jgi:hypothetical protein